jgi:cysteine synthase B
MAVYSSVTELIGNTPIVDVSTLSPNPDVRLYAKLEGQNPGGSVKDRIALAMLDAAEADGTLRPGQTLIEPSSGNTGIALAMLCRLRGYPLKIVLPENVSVERRQLLEVFGAEVILSPGAEGSNGAVRRAEALAAEHPEWALLYHDLPDLTHFVAGLGTSGTLLGVGTYLKEQNPAIEVWAVEAPVGETVEGLRNFDEVKWGGPDLLDRKMIVRPKESLEATRMLVSQCGIFAGISSGAALAGARKAASRIDSGVICFVVSDGGWKYLSTGAFTDPIDEVAERAKRLIYF